MLHTIAVCKAKDTAAGRRLLMCCCRKTGQAKFDSSRSSSNHENSDHGSTLHLSLGGVSFPPRQCCLRAAQFHVNQHFCAVEVHCSQGSVNEPSSICVIYTYTRRTRIILSLSTINNTDKICWKCTATVRVRRHAVTSHSW